MRLPPDFRDLISEFNAERVDYIIVGAYAMGAYGMPRYTGDIDFFYRATQANAEKIIIALERFGYSGSEISVESLLMPSMVHYFGRPPLRVDLLNDISGVTFDEAWGNRSLARLEELDVNILGLDQLAANKLASARSKDLVDLEVIEKARSVLKGRKS